MSLGDIKSVIIAVVNDALREAYSGTQLDTAIQLCLNDLSNENLLVSTDESQSLTSGDLSINYPTDYKDLVAITLVDSSNVEGKPLKKLPGGHKTYRELRDNDASTGITSWFSEFDDKFWLWRPANGSYTPKIEYYRRHPQTPDYILFGDDFRNAIYFGAIYYKALLEKKTDYIAIWRPVYLVEKEERRLAAPEQPRITRG